MDLTPTFTKIETVTNGDAHDHSGGDGGGRGAVAGGPRSRKAAGGENTGPEATCGGENGHVEPEAGEKAQRRRTRFRQGRQDGQAEGLAKDTRAGLGRRVRAAWAVADWDEHLATRRTAGGVLLSCYVS